MQFQTLGFVMGDYEGAATSILAMAALLLFVIVHVAMVALVPRTFRACSPAACALLQTEDIG